MPRFIYVLDPMCSWCWAFSATIDKLRTTYPEYEWTILLGGLAPDSNEAMPLEMQQKLQSIWQHIEQQTGTPFNYDFWTNNTPRRSTYPACRAVLSAENLAPGSSFEMIKLIQNAYYQDALNPSDDSTLVKLAAVIGLKPEPFLEQLNSQATQLLLEQQIEQAYSLGAQGFPSLFLQTDHDIVPLCYGYSDIEKLTQRIESVRLKNGNNE